MSSNINIDSEKMPEGGEPLLAGNNSFHDSERPQSEDGELDLDEQELEQARQDVAEEDQLLNGDSHKIHTQSRSSRRRMWREVALFVWALIATALVVLLAVVYQKSKSEILPSEPIPFESQSNDHCPPFPSIPALVPPSHSLPARPFPAAASPTGKRNLVFMISDGMGVSSMTLSRAVKQRQEGPPWTDSLEIDKFLIGQSRTRSSSSLITDSAAGATAFACGEKTYNGGIAVNPDGLPMGTVLEAAKKAGYMTGLVVTTAITDATPAVWASHVHSRHEEDMIAQQLIGNGPLGHVVDIMLGGGRCRFRPNSSDDLSCREDDQPLVQMAEDKGYSWIGDRVDFDNLTLAASINLPLLGLFADDKFPYEIDILRSKERFPSLQEMSLLALRALSEATRDSDKGFFLMIEGSRIDHAGHVQDPAAQAQEVLAYDEAFSATVDFIQKDKVPGLVLSTSDHETGGLSTARQLNPDVYPEYHWFPSKLRDVVKSAEYMSYEYSWFLDEEPRDDAAKRKFLLSKLESCFAIDDPSDDEMRKLMENPDAAQVNFASMISRRSQVGFTTHGHSGADVNIYASDPAAAASLAGNVDNTEIGRFLQDYLGVDVEPITKQLRNAMNQSINGQNWLGPALKEGTSYSVHSHYEGEFKTRTKRGQVNYKHFADWASPGWC